MISYIIIFSLFIFILKHLFFWKPLNTDYLFKNGPLMIGHRGVPNEVPENTIEGFKTDNPSSEALIEFLNNLKVDFNIRTSEQDIPSFEQLKTSIEYAKKHSDSDTDILKGILNGINTIQGNIKTKFEKSCRNAVIHKDKIIPYLEIK